MPTVWSVGHGTRPLDELLAMSALAASGVEYVHLRGLGGRRGAGKSERHRIWDVARVVDGRLVYDGGAIPLPAE